MTTNSRVPTSPVSVRPRVRALDVDAAAPVDEIRLALEAYVKANEEKNAATRAEAAAQKALERALSAKGQTTAKEVIGNTQYTVTFLPGTRAVVDVRSLYSKVDLDVFLSIVTASQGAVKDAVGSNILASVVKDKDTDASLKIKKEPAPLSSRPVAH